jgi:hypothetical protein
MLDCNNNTQIFEDNHGIFKLIESHNYSLSNDIYNQLVYKLEKYDDREILEIIPAKFKYLYEKIIKKLNIPSETLLNPLNNINNLDHIIKMISIYHNIKYDYNIFQLLDDYAMSSLGLIYTYIDFNNINFNNVKVKFSLNNEIIKTDITFNNYIHLFKNNYDPSNIDKLNKALSKPETKRNLRSRTKTKSIIKKGGSPLPIITQQGFITNETIYYYFQNKDNIQSFPPAILEYDDKNNQFIVVDGNNRLAFYTIRNIMYGLNDKIPVIIAIKNINDKFNDTI